MTVHSLAPGFIKLFYVGPALITHVQTIGINNLSVVGSSYEIELKSGTSELWTDSVDTYVAIAKVFTPVTVTWLYAELWSKPLPDDDPIFLEAYDVNVAGTQSGTANALSQVTISYRAANGSNGKVVFLETSLPPNTVYRPPTYGIASHLTFVTYLTGALSMVFSRGDAYPLFVPKIITKTNDAIRKRVLLDA